MPQIVSFPVAPTGTPQVIAVTVLPDDGFDARWNAWLARGQAQDRAMNRRLVFLAPMLVLAAAIAAFMLVL